MIASMILKYHWHSVHCDKTNIIYLFQKHKLNIIYLVDWDIKMICSTNSWSVDHIALFILVTLYNKMSFVNIKGIVHFEIKIWYLSAYPKGIQDVGVFFSSVDPILMFLGQTVLVCQSYNGRYRSLSL